MRTRAHRITQVAARIAEHFVVLELKDSYGLGYLVGPGLVVSTLQVVHDEPSIIAHFSNGQIFNVRELMGVDARRDLVALCASSDRVSQPQPLKTPERLVDEKTPLWGFSLSRDRRRICWMDLKVSNIQVLNEGLTVYRLEGHFPVDISGSPLFSEAGEFVAVATLAQSDEGSVALGIPIRYVTRLLAQPVSLPLSELVMEAKIRRRRLLPQFSVDLLQGSSAKSLEQLSLVLSGTINLATPAFLRHDWQTCWGLYSETAQRWVREPVDCPGPKQALIEGLKRAGSLGDMEARARMLRDLFDALLMLLEKSSRTRPSSQPGRQPKAPKLFH